MGEGLLKDCRTMMEGECEVSSSQVVFVGSEEPKRAEAQHQTAAVSKSRRRHNVKSGHKCPICGQIYADVAQRVTELKLS